MSAAQSGAEAPAIKALGPLFKITEVFLWDDAVVTMPEPSTRHDAFEGEPRGSYTTGDANLKFNHTINDHTSVEDLELAQQMESLGLPISFSTTSKKINVATRGRKIGMRLKSVSADKVMENKMPGASGVAELKDVTSSKVFRDSTSGDSSCKTTEGQSAASHDEEGHNRGHVLSDEESINSYELSNLSVDSYVEKEIMPDGVDSERNAEFSEQLTSLDANYYPENMEGASSSFYQGGKLSNKEEEGKNLKGSSVSCHIIGAKSDGDDISSSQPCVSSIESSLSCAFVVNHIQDNTENSICCEFGEWRVFWDAFYMRNYFYNFQTQESTWYPPPGLEHVAISCSTSNSQVFADEAKDDAGSRFACDAIEDQYAYSLQDRTDTLQETKYTVKCTDQPSQKLSPKMNHATQISISGINGFAADSSPVKLDKHANAKDSDERIPFRSSDVEGCAKDELESSGYLDKREENPTCPEAWNASDVSLEVSIKDSLTRALNEVGCEKNWRRGSLETYMTSTMDDLVRHHEIAALKKKKRVRRLQSQQTSGVIVGLPVNIVKYWCQRYLLFSRFDNGIKMDEEGWFSVTPEPIARHHASRCGSGTIIDCFTGVGGNAIQFALRSNHVIAIDIDEQKIDYAQHNAAIYGVDDRIDFIKGDFFQIAPRLKGDTVFMSPPWGGPDYVKVQTYDITSMLKPHDGCFIFKIAKMIASRVIMFLPRNVDINQLAELSLSVNPPWALEVEKSFLNGKLKAITAYFSNTTV